MVVVSCQRMAERIRLRIVISELSWPQQYTGVAR